jgi:hypothetical protein
MISVHRVSILTAIALLLICFSHSTADVAEEGSLYKSDLLTVKLDGSFGDWPSDAHWHKVSHSMAWDRPMEGVVLPASDADASFEFACVIGGKNLYVAVKIQDDKKVVDENMGDDVYMDDSIEIYIDGDNSKSSEYEPDVSQITIGRYNTGRDPERPLLNSWTGMNEQGKAAADTGTMAAVVDTDYGWAVEAAVPLASFGIEAMKGTVIGFNMQLNDDDDGDGPDHKLSWSVKELTGNNASFKDPSVFGELKITSAESPQLKEKTAMKEYPQALLGNDVKAFDDLIGRVGHHAVAVGDEVYTQPCVYLSLHLVQMRAAGWKDVDFDQIAAVSGASALFAYEQGAFEPKYANLSIGMDGRIAEATGFGYEWVNFKGMDGAWGLIKESVDSGKSVKGWDWENIMFAGYQDAPEPEGRKIYAMADGPGTFSEWWTWKEFGEYVKRIEGWGCPQFGRHTERVPTKPANVVALRVIKDLVEWSTNPPEHLLKKYPKATFGLAGIELYADHCADMEKFEDFGSCHDINPQWPIRNSTSVYLKQVADANVFPEKLDAHLLEAADEYRAAYIYWKQFFNHLSYGGGEGWGKIAEHRLAGTEGIRKALEHEKVALSELKAMLEKHQTGDLFSYGFRYDPLEFVKNSKSLQAVLVRRHVFHDPLPGDDEIIQKRIAEILAGQKEDGSLGEPGHEKAELLMELADLGVDPNRPEVKKAIEAALRGNDEDPDPWIRDVRALCMLGVTDPPEIKAALESVVDREEEWNGPWKICPWGQAFYLRALWEAREVVDTKDLMASILTWMGDGLNDAGCITFKDPWGLIWAAGIIDLPEAEHLVELEVPTILRGQRPDGGWGTGPYGSWSMDSLKVFQALVNHGYFDKLRELPPLPPDWEIVREIPAPDGDLFTMTYDGKRLWVLDRKAQEAIAVSPDDGSVQKRLRIPFEKIGGIGWWDDGLGATQQDQKRLIKLHPETGEIISELSLKGGPDWIQVFDFARVNGELWVSDGFNGCVARREASDPEKVSFLTLGGPQPISIAAAPDGVWHVDAFAPIIARTSFDGKLLEWGEKPFDGRCDGLAWDGEHLWALDCEGKRICVIEKNVN